MENQTKKHSNKKMEKKRENDRGGTLTQGPGNTIRSKIENKLTEEKLKDRESATDPNTPWAPSGPERISKLPAARFRFGPGGRGAVQRKDSISVKVPVAYSAG